MWLFRKGSPSSVRLPEKRSTRIPRSPEDHEGYKSFSHLDERLKIVSRLVPAVRMPVYFVLIPPANAEIVPFVWETKKWFQLLIAETILSVFGAASSESAPFGSLSGIIRQWRFPPQRLRSQQCSHQVPQIVIIQQVRTLGSKEYDTPGKKNSI